MTTPADAGDGVHRSGAVQYDCQYFPRCQTSDPDAALEIQTAVLSEIVISVKNGKLWFDSKRSPKLTGEMLPFKGNSFVVKWNDRSMDADAYVIFSLDERGLASGVTMKPISPLTDFSYDFQDLDFKSEK